MVGGSIPAQDLLCLRPRQGGARLVVQDGSRRALHGDRDQSGRLDQAGVHAAVALNGFSVVDFAEQKEVDQGAAAGAAEQYDHGGYRTNEPSHGIGISPDNKTLWVTSIPNNAVYAYDVATLKVIGKVDLPSEKVAGHDEPLSAVPEWVTFTPDGKYLYVSNAGAESVSVVDTAAMKSSRSSRSAKCRSAAIRW